MTLTEARKILGLRPNQDPRPHLENLRWNRERIAKKVRNAPTETTATQFQETLMAYDKALAAIRESLDSPTPFSAYSAAPEPVAVFSKTPILETKPKKHLATPSRRFPHAWAALFIFLTAFIAGWFRQGRSSDCGGRAAVQQRRPFV